MLWRRQGGGRFTEKGSETFEREVLRLQAARAGDDVSYKTASDGGATGGPVPPPHNEARRNLVQGWSTEDRPPPPPPPPPPRPVEGGGEATTAFRFSEALRNLELPSLPPPGGEGSLDDGHHPADVRHCGIGQAVVGAGPAEGGAYLCGVANGDAAGEAPAEADAGGC